MPFDLATIDEVLARIKRVTPSPPGSVRELAIQAHEILGGETDKPKLFAKGYFLAWLKGGISAPVASAFPSAEPGAQLANVPEIFINSPSGPVADFPLRFTVVDGGGFLEDGKTVLEKTTNSEGKAAASSWTMGPAAGRNTVLVEGFGASERFTITTTTIE